MNHSNQLSLEPALNEDFSFDLEDLGVDIGEESSDLQKPVATKEDSFDFMYSITPLGINFNVVLKEKPETLKNILSLVLSHVEDRGRVKEFLKDCDIFIAHMNHVLDDMYETGHELYDTANDICLIFKENVNFLRSRLRVYNYSGVAIDSDSDNFNSLIKSDGENQYAFDVYSLTQYETQNRIRAEIAFYKHKDLNNSPVFLYCNEFDSLLEANDNVTNLMVFVKQMLATSSSSASKGLEKCLTSGKTGEFASKSPSYQSSVLDMIRYTKRSYEYTENEVRAMEILGFPSDICNREEFLKPNIELIIQDKANKTKLIHDDKNYDMRNYEKSKDVLLWMKKAKVYIQSKENKADMGALYF